MSKEAAWKFFIRYVNLNGELSQNLLPYSDMKTFGLIFLDSLEEKKVARSGDEFFYQLFSDFHNKWRLLNEAN